MVINSPDAIKKALKSKSFKVAIFGSARIKETDKSYKEIYKLAKMIGQRDIDLVTGEGPGLMKAANAGHTAGRNSDHIKSIGLLINIPHERKETKWLDGENKAKWLDIEHMFARFSDRLDNFMLLSNAVVVAPGGIGTMLELFYTWQLMQAQKIRHIPVILLGDMWPDFLRWMRQHPLRYGFIDKSDLKLLHVAKNAEEAMRILEKEHKRYRN